MNCENYKSESYGSFKNKIFTNIKFFFIGENEIQKFSELVKFKETLVKKSKEEIDKTLFEMIKDSLQKYISFNILIEESEKNEFVYNCKDIYVQLDRLNITYRFSSLLYKS